MGKTEFALERLLNDIKAGNGVCYVDPHGYDTDRLLNYIPPARRADTTVFDPSQYAIPWNPLITDNVPLTASTYDTSIRVAYNFADMSTARMSGVLYNSLVALIEAKQPMFGLFLILDSQAYRDHVIPRVKNEVVRRFWLRFGKLPLKQQQDMIESTYNKVQALMADPRICAISGTQDVLDIRDKVKDKILFLRLPQGQLGVEKVKLLGNLLLTQIHQACLGRDTTVPYSLYIDECHTFAPHILKEMLSGIRKFNVEVTMIHQYTSQLERELRDSLRANADQYIFRVSMDDALDLPKPKPQDVQLWEQDPFEYSHFDALSYERRRTSPLSHRTYDASARIIRSNIKRNLVAPATKEVDRLLGDF